MRMIAGLTGMDRFAPRLQRHHARRLLSPSPSRLIERYHRKGRNLYAITPRFSVGCSDEMMERCRQLKQEHDDCWINTHISENPTELCTSRRQSPGLCRLHGGPREARPARAEVRGGARGLALQFRVPAVREGRSGGRVLPALEPVPGERPVPPGRRDSTRRTASASRSAATWAAATRSA